MAFLINSLLIKLEVSLWEAILSNKLIGVRKLAVHHKAKLAILFEQ